MSSSWLDSPIRVAGLPRWAGLFIELDIYAGTVALWVVGRFAEAALLSVLSGFILSIRISETRYRSSGSRGRHGDTAVSEGMPAATVTPLSETSKRPVGPPSPQRKGLGRWGRFWVTWAAGAAALLAVAALGGGLSGGAIIGLAGLLIVLTAFHAASFGGSRERKRPD
jgi:hypothetical protein